MKNIEHLHDNLSTIFECYKSGISGQSYMSQVAEGKHELKNLFWFRVLKYSTQGLSILLLLYIIYKIAV